MSESPQARSNDPTAVRSVLATDCGSTTTKAILIERNERGEYRLVTRGEAPTTVSLPRLPGRHMPNFDGSVETRRSETVRPSSW